MNDTFILGEYNACCRECERKFKSSQLKKHWKGYYVCAACWEPRHPQDFAGKVPEPEVVPWSQPPLEPVLVEGGIPDAEPFDPLAD